MSDQSGLVVAIPIKTFFSNSLCLCLSLSLVCVCYGSMLLTRRR